MLIAESQNETRENEIADAVFIYGLVCPIERLVRYVGQTNKPYPRLFGHVRGSKNPGMREWLDGLLVDGRLPMVITLEVTTHSAADQREKTWIHHYYRRHADRLLNIALVPSPPAWFVKSSRAGRPPIGDVPFDTKMLIECMTDQKSEWKRAAKAGGMSLSAWVRSVLDANS